MDIAMARAAGPAFLATLLLVAAPAAAGGEAPAAPLGGAEGERLDLVLEQVLRIVDPALQPAAPDAASSDPRALSRWLDAVLADWESRRDAPLGILDPAGVQAVPEPIVRALQRVAGSAHRCRRVESESGGTLVPDELLTRHLEALRLLVAKYAGGGTPTTAPAPPRSVLPLLAAMAPENDDCASATPIGDGSYAGTTVGAGSDGAAACGASDGAADAWFLYTASRLSTVTFDTFGSAYDTVLSLHSGCPGTDANQLACNDDTFDLRSRVSRHMSAGETVLVRISGSGGAAGSYVLNVGDEPQIAGSVTDAATDDPLVDVKVHVHDSFGSLTDWTTTNGAGRYSFHGLSPSDHYVRTRSVDHVDELYDDMPCVGSCVMTQGTPVQPSSAGSSSIDFALDLGGSISGTVTEDADSAHPLANVAVQVLTAEGFLRKREFTSADGSYRVAGLPTGTYRVRTASVSHVNELYDDVPCIGHCDATAGVAVEVIAGADTSGIDFALEVGGAIGGTVTDAASGEPLGSVRLDFFDDSGVLHFSFTDSTGNYLRRGLSSGNWFVLTSTASHLDELYDDLPCDPSCEPTAGTAIPVVQGTTTSAIDFALDRRPSVAGTVREAGSGAGLADVQVTAYNTRGGVVAITHSTFDGTYLLDPLPAGLLHIVASRNDTHATQVLDGLPFGLDVLLAPPVLVDRGLRGVDFDLWPLGACGMPQSLSAAGASISSHAELAACTVLSAGDGFEIGSSGRVELRAGGAVVLHDGFRVQTGGRLVIAAGSTLPSPSDDVVYREDFDDGFALGWDTSHGTADLWRLDSDCATTPPGTRILGFSRSTPDCDYDHQALTPVGWARSPLLDLSAVPQPTLRIEHRWETEGSTSFDRMTVEVSSDGGISWTPIWSKPSFTSDGFVVDRLDLSGSASSSFRFRFVFDALDRISNDFSGWQIAEVAVIAE